MTAAASSADDPAKTPASEPAPAGPAARVERLDDGAGGAEWDAFVSSASAATLYHRYLWRDVVRSVFGHETHYLAARLPGGEIGGVLPLVRLKSLLFGDFLVSLPYFNYGGVVARSAPIRDVLLAAAIGLARELGCRHLELRHREPLAESWPARADKVAMWLTLPQTSEEMWSGLPSKVRSDARRGARHGASSEFGGTELLADFYAVFAENMRDLGTPVYPAAFFRAMLSAFPANASLNVTRLGGRAVAAAFLMEHAGSMEVPWASSLRRFNKYAVNMHMYGALLERAVVRGCRTFDFGRSTLGGGTYLFKKQWGAQPAPLYWHYWLRGGGELPKLRPDNPRFRAAVAAWRRLPITVANWIGPHIVKNLP